MPMTRSWTEVVGLGCAFGQLLRCLLRQLETSQILRRFTRWFGHGGVVAGDLGESRHHRKATSRDLFQFAAWLWFCFWLSFSGDFFHFWKVMFSFCDMVPGFRKLRLARKSSDPFAEREDNCRRNPSRHPNGYLTDTKWLLVTKGWHRSIKMRKKVLDIHHGRIRMDYIDIDWY